MLAFATASMVAFAQPPASTPAPATSPTPAATPAPTSAPAPVVSKKEKAQAGNSFVVSPPYAPPLILKNNKEQHMGGVNSQPWAQVVGWRPGYSAFLSPEQHEPSMPIFWFGKQPW